MKITKPTRKATKHLCIGGPLDRRKVAHPMGNHHPYMECAIPAPMMAIVTNKPPPPMEIGAYKKETFAEVGRKYSAWIWHDVKYPLGALLAAYEEPAVFR